MRTGGRVEDGQRRDGFAAVGLGRNGGEGAAIYGGLDFDDGCLEDVVMDGFADSQGFDVLLKEADYAFPDAAVVWGGGWNEIPLNSLLFELSRCGFIVVDELLLEDLVRRGHV